MSSVSGILVVLFIICLYHETCSLKCLRNQFACLDGTECVRMRWRCDGLCHCADSSDEAGCVERPSCPEDEHRCDNGTCVPKSSCCDGWEDCGDGSDEKGCDECETWGCSQNCSDTPLGPQCFCEEGFRLDPKDNRTCNADCLGNHFACLDGTQCIRMLDRCDGRSTCSDGSDEAGCDERRCTGSDHLCGNGRCIPASFVCDGWAHCDDESDEKDCDKCENWGCSQNCTETSHGPKCSCKVYFTLNPTDNRTCDAPSLTCMKDEFMCWDLKKCVANEYLCDDTKDCFDSSDESGCPEKPPCPEGEYRCDSGSCKRRSWLCDGVPDCVDGSDEKDCRAGSCKPRSWFCDGVPDCADGSDEKGCVPPPTCPEGEFLCNNGECIVNEYRCNNVFDCLDSSDELGCPDDSCPEGQYRCGTGSCLPRSWFCDGAEDCDDSSDEKDCDPSPKCLKNQFPCKDRRKCITKFRRCDFGEDCHDRSDEAACEDGRCPEGHHRCGNGRCLPKSFVCDGSPDCRDGSDERDCDKCENWGCLQNCTETSSGPQCLCEEGFELDPKDKRTCKVSSPIRHCSVHSYQVTQLD